MGNRQRESYTPDGCDRQNGDVQCAKRVGQHTAASVDCPDVASAIKQGAKGATLKYSPSEKEMAGQPAPKSRRRVVVFMQNGHNFPDV